MLPPLAGAAAAPPVGPGPSPPRAPASFGEALQRVMGGGARGAAPPPVEPRRLLEDVDRARARLDDLIREARSGRSFGARELLALQAQAYRTVQTVELAVKLAEQGAQAVRQALGTQV